jgi:hypothetical protein
VTFARLGSHFSSLLYWGLLSKLSATRDYTWRWTWKTFFRGTGITLGFRVFWGVYTQNKFGVHTHTQREPSHTWFSIYFGFPRLGSFFFRRKESRTGFFLFAGVTQVQFTIHTHRDVGKLPTEQHGRRQSRHSIAEKLVTWRIALASTTRSRFPVRWWITGTEFATFFLSFWNHLTLIAIKFPRSLKANLA